MTDPPRDVEPGRDGRADSAPEGTSGLAPWQKVVGVIGLVVLVVFLVLLLVRGHTPRPHGSAGRVPEDAVEIVATADDLAFDPPEHTVTAGDRVALVLRSVDVLHHFTLDAFDIQVVATPGETATGWLRADRPGRYAFSCSMPGHRRAGMEGSLVVQAGSVALRGPGRRDRVARP